MKRDQTESAKPIKITNTDIDKMFEIICRSNTDHQNS